MQETVEATAVQVTAAPQNGVVGGVPVAQAAAAHPLRLSWTPEQPPANGGFGLQQEQEPVEAVAVEVTASPQNGVGGGTAAVQAAPPRTLYVRVGSPSSRPRPRMIVPGAHYWDTNDPRSGLWHGSRSR